MRMRWKPGARAAKAKPRVYKPEKRQWLSAQMAMVEEAVLVYSNPQAVFSSVSVAVPNGGGSYRLVADYLTVSQQLEAVPWP